MRLGTLLGPDLKQLLKEDPEQLNELLTGLGAAIDAVGGGFSTHYTAVAVTAVRGGQAPDRPRAPGDPSA